MLRGKKAILVLYWAIREIANRDIEFVLKIRNNALLLVWGVSSEDVRFDKRFFVDRARHCCCCCCVCVAVVGDERIRRLGCTAGG